MPSPLPQDALGVEQERSPNVIRAIIKLIFKIVKKDISYFLGERKR
jgi:hypothetical protein